MSDLNEVKNVFHRGGYTCVLVKENNIITSNKCGIVPLLEIIDGNIDVKGYAAADKIVGKAAALLYIYMGVNAVYAEVMSTAAADVLRGNNISFEYGTLTEKIINRKGDGPCPMECAVENVSSPSVAVETLRKKLNNLKSKVK